MDAPEEPEWSRLAKYHAIGEYLSEDNINLMKNKWQNHRIEFAEAGAVFFVIEP